MCGIVGFTNRKKGFENEELEIRKMSEKIAHRGENEEGYYFANNTYLGHRRLSIRDIQHGSQPMSFTNSSSAKYTIVYNGEIYNEKELIDFLNKNNVILKTKSDTEILLKLYILIRDKFGVKPLYYTIFEDRDIAFSSEMKGILCLDRVRAVVDVNGIKQLLGLGPALPIGKCVFKGISEVMPRSLFDI